MNASAQLPTPRLPQSTAYFAVNAVKGGCGWGVQHAARGDRDHTHTHTHTVYAGVMWGWEGGEDTATHASSII